MDKLFDSALIVIFWPWDAASGRNAIVKLVAITIGWLWILPMILLVGLPCLFVVVAAEFVGFTLLKGRRS